MFNNFFACALGITAACASSAVIAAPPTMHAPHYEWRPARQNGPRDPLKAPVRVWIYDGPIDQAQPSVPKSAADVLSPAGHFVWKTVPQWGPRLPLRAPIRVWVSDEPKNARDMRNPA